MITLADSSVDFMYGVPWGITFGKTNCFPTGKEYHDPYKEDTDMSLLIAVKREHYAILMSDSRTLIESEQNGQKHLVVKSDHCKKIIHEKDFLVGFTGIYDYENGYIEDLIRKELKNIPSNNKELLWETMENLHQKLRVSLRHDKLDITAAYFARDNIHINCITGNYYETTIYRFDNELTFFATGILINAKLYHLPESEDIKQNIQFARHVLQDTIEKEQAIWKIARVGGPLQGYLVDENGIQKIC